MNRCICVRVCDYCVYVWLHVIMCVCVTACDYICEPVYVSQCDSMYMCEGDNYVCHEIVCIIMCVSVRLYMFLVIANHLRIWYLKQPSLTSPSVSVGQNCRIGWSVSLFKASFGCSQRTSQRGRGATPMLTHLL